MFYVCYCVRISFSYYNILHRLCLSYVLRCVPPFLCTLLLSLYVSVDKNTTSLCAIQRHVYGFFFTFFVPYYSSTCAYTYWLVFDYVCHGCHNYIRLSLPWGMGIFTMLSVPCE